MHKREPGDFGDTCATDAATWFITVEIWIDYVTEIHIWVKPDSCLGTKSVVKGLYLALWNAYANQGPCLYDLGQKQNVNIAQVEWEYLVHVHFTVGPRWSRVYSQNAFISSSLNV